MNPGFAALHSCVGRWIKLQGFWHILTTQSLPNRQANPVYAATSQRKLRWDSIWQGSTSQRKSCWIVGCSYDSLHSPRLVHLTWNQSTLPIHERVKPVARLQVDSTAILGGMAQIVRAGGSSYWNSPTWARFRSNHYFFMFSRMGKSWNIYTSK